MMFTVNREQALDARKQASARMDSGDFQQAERLAIKALECRPACKLAYQILGKLFDHQGAVEFARECRKGRLPLEFLQRYFDAALNSLGDASVENRQVVYAEHRVELSAPLALVNESKAPFNRTEIIAAPGFIDTLASATFWHDSSSTLVLDSEGKHVQVHDCGDVQLLQSLRQAYLPQHLNGRVILLGARGAHNYYHWVADIIPKLGILRAGGFSFLPDDTFVVSHATAGFTRALLNRAGVADTQIVQSESCSPYISADELVVPFLKNTMGYTMGAWLPQAMQEIILGEPSLAAAAKRKLFVSRDAHASAGRTIGNQSDVEDLFERNGFEIVKPELLSVVEQARLFSEAAVVAGPHGAGFSNLVYCAPGTKVIEFYGAHAAPCYWVISALAGLEYYHHNCLEGPAAEDAASRRSASFNIPLDAADQLLQKAGCK